MEAGSIETLLRVAGGDMRRAITTLQSAARLNEGAVGPQGITDVAGVVPDSIMMALLGECRQKSFDRLQVAVQDTLAEAYPAQQVLLQMADLIAEAGDIKDVSKAAIFAVFSEADFALCEGADDYLQLLRVCSEMQRILTQ